MLKSVKRKTITLDVNTYLTNRELKKKGMWSMIGIIKIYQIKINSNKKRR